MGSPDLASRRWVWEQYDHMVGADTIQRPGGDAAVVRVHDTKKALAMSTDVTPRYCFADPVEGGRQAIAECWRNITAVGATRSEEHTSELQSLMRISYAVFCLKQNKALHKHDQNTRYALALSHTHCH